MEKITSVSAELVPLASGQTVRATVTTEHGAQGIAEIPAGITVGAGEAVLVDPAQAVTSIQSIVAPALTGMDCLEQREVDVKLMEFDDSPDRHQLGVNALLPVSLAVARAGAAALERELYVHLADLAGTTPRLPTPIQVMIEGGKHAEGSPVSIQEFSIIGPVDAGEATLTKLESIAAARSLACAPGGEGGLVVGANTNADAFELLVEAIQGTDLRLALDVAASHAGATSEIEALLAAVPLALVEDPVPESDLAAWQTFTRQYGQRFLVAADDLTVGNPARIKDAVKDSVANCLVVKLNQTATLSELFDLVALVRVGNWQVVVSHRGHETTDSFVTDLAVGLGAEFLKAGTTRSPERKPKYDRLLAIANQLARNEP
ncbi:hypothetical protein HY374_00210 [Candidatus Berkelbacteria bacterium]|nr:hypothetical protein [Candidatus Berkelbacteria bacterium]